MPKSNPKHQRKNAVLERQQSLTEGSFPTRYLVMALIFIGAVTTIIILVVTLKPGTTPETTNVIVQNGDIVKMEYKIWKNPTGEANAILKERFPDFTESNYERNVSQTSIVPLGLYQYILGKSKGHTGYFSIEPNRDEDGNGFDDDDGEPVLGYSKSRPDFYNVRLTFYVEIKNITKGAINAPNASGNIPSESSLHSYMQMNSVLDLFVLKHLF